MQQARITHRIVPPPTPDNDTLETLNHITDLIYQGKHIRSPEVRLALHHLCIKGDVLRLEYGNNANKLREALQ